MSWTALTVIWSKRAEKDLRGVPAKDQSQIRATVDAFAATGQGDAKKMQDGSGWRLRVRSYRAFLTIDWTAKELHVQAVSTRGDAY